MSFALVMILTMNARRFQRSHLLSGMGSSLGASKENGREALTLRSPVDPSQVLQWSAQLALVAYLNPGSYREDRSSIASCTFIHLLCRIVSHVCIFETLPRQVAPTSTCRRFSLRHVVQENGFCKTCRSIATVWSGHYLPERELLPRLLRSTL